MPEPCTFGKAQRISLALCEQANVKKEISPLPNAGAGVVACRSFDKGEAVMEVKGPLVHSFQDEASGKYVSLQVRQHQAEIYRDDRHILLLGGLQQPDLKGQHLPQLTYGIEPVNTARFMNSSITGGQSNLEIKTIIDPALVSCIKNDKVILKPHPLHRRQLHVFAVAAAPIKTGEELLFEYTFANDTSHIHIDSAAVLDKEIKATLKAQDPKGEKYREQNGCFFHQTPDSIIEELSDDKTPTALQIIEILRQLKATPTRYSLQNQLLQIEHPKALEAFIVSVLYQKERQLSHRVIYNLCDRLNRFQQHNIYNHSTTWNYSDVYRLCTDHNLLPPLEEGAVMPMEFIVGDQEETDDKSQLHKSLRAKLSQGKRVSSIAANMSRMGVVMPDHHTPFSQKSLITFCQEQQLKPTVGHGRESVWNECRSGNTAVIWQCLEDLRDRQKPLSRIVKELNRHKAQLGQRTSGEAEVTLGDLVDFIQQTGSPTQKRQWLQIIRSYIKTHVSCANAGRMITKGIRITNNEWLLLAYLEAKIEDRTAENIYLARNLNNARIPVPKGESRWSHDVIARLLTKHNKTTLLSHYQATRGVNPKSGNHPQRRKQ
ncbi:hypothetical protein [Parendozoicomonas haliclonae]|uniref:hypothetical protein n=1 Tax=Parendozoicomonas haliclonae TaxID=1960125 RepID=UPI000B35D724|nr:hypothetical protein [Parendozoicomonas haliclonae]